MLLLKLYHQSDPVQPVDAHMLGEGTVKLGRDPSADWVVPDPECEISRHHADLTLRNGSLSVRPLGANGVFRGDGEERLPQGEDVQLEVGDSFAFGKFRVIVEKLPFAQRSSQAAGQTMVMAPPFGSNTSIPTEWEDAGELPPLKGDGSLLEAFCEGAKLDASAFSDEDQAEVMRRAGAMYRQMVLGLGDLMSERSSAKTQYRMDRTTIGAQDNNPFKWAPTQRLAIDLLRRHDSGFLSGPAALRESFEDVKKHLLSTLAGFRASLIAALKAAAPDAVEKRLEGQSHFLKSKGAAAWEEYEKVHADLARQVAEDLDGPINQAFLRAYEEHMRALERGEGR